MAGKTMTSTPNAPAHVLPSAQATTPAGSPVGGFLADDNTVRFEIPGKPFAKQRARVGKWGGYTPKETVSFERAVGQIAMDNIETPFEGAVCVDITAIFETPKSWSKKKTADHIWQAHTQRPDLDNLAKAILDGLNRIAFADDGQVSRMKCKKQWGDKARTIVIIKPDRGAL